MFKRLSVAAVALAVSMTVAHAEEPRSGGTIRYTAPYGASFSNLDIHTSQRIQDTLWARAIHRSLYSWDAENQEPVLDLAKSVSVSDDGLTHTYELRDDAYFHNGRAMTADDIIWTFNRLMDGTRGFPGARYVRLIEGAVAVEKGGAETISGLKKVDDHTIQMTLTERVDPGYHFYTMETAVYPAEEAQEEGFASHPIGLGPFKLAEYIPGSRLVAERWEKFYLPGLPYADEIVISIMGEASARDVAFRNKEIDASILGPAQYVAYQSDPELSKGLFEVAENFTRLMGMNPNFKPFSDKRVRQAINHAINADLIIERLAKGKAYRAVGYLPLSSPAFDDSMKPYAYDPEKAKALLAEAGYPDGFSFEWTATANESWGIPIVEAIIPMLAKVGITVTIKPVDGSVLAETIRKGDFQAFIWSLRTGPDPLTVLKCFHSSTPQSACNYTLYNNPEVDKLLEKAGATSDPEERIEALRKVNAIIYEDAPYWFFNYNKAVMAYQPWLHGLQPNANELAEQSYELLWVDDTSPAAN